MIKGEATSGNPFADPPPDVGKGSAFPFGLINLEEAMPPRQIGSIAS